MRILQVAPFFSPHIGGVEKHVLEVSRSLAERGHSVSVFTVSHEKGLSERETIGRVGIIRAPFGGKGYFSRLFSAWRFVIRNWKEFRGFDIIHLHDFPSFAWLLFLPGKKTITFHGYERDPVTLKHRILRKFAEKFTRSNFCVGTHLVRHYGTACPKERIIVGGVDSGKIKKQAVPFRKKERKKILFLTRLARDTQIREFVLAMKNLPGFSLEVYGEGPLKDELTKLAKSERLKVRFLGKWPGDSNDLFRKYQFVFAARQLTILEALGNGAIVFSVHTSEIMKDLLVGMGSPREAHILSGSVGELAERFREIAGEPEKSLLLRSEKGKRYALSLDWGKIAKSYLEEYSRIL